MAIGADCGTLNLITCTRDDQNNFVYKKEVNAFLEISLENKFTFNMMKNAGVPLIERENVAYVLGQSALDLAYTMNLEVRRPMSSGCLNPKEREAFQIMSIMLHSMLDDVKKDGETLYYSVPANAINEETDANYHSKVLEAIFKAYKSDKGFKVDPHPINEGLALVYAELGKKAYTGIGVSCGAGEVNVCFAMYGSPVFNFAIVNSGDWIDKQASKATGESVAFINREKNKIDLTKAPTNFIERAIHTQYKLMVEHTVTEIKKAFTMNAKNIRTENEIDIVLAGGSSSPLGFVTMFKDTLTQVGLPIKIGDVIRPNEPLYSVARGVLLAAEAAR